MEKGLFSGVIEEKPGLGEGKKEIIPHYLQKKKNKNFQVKNPRCL